MLTNPKAVKIKPNMVINSASGTIIIFENIAAYVKEEK